MLSFNSLTVSILCFIYVMNVSTMVYNIIGVLTRLSLNVSVSSYSFVREMETCVSVFDVTLYVVCTVLACRHADIHICTIFVKL